MFRIILLASLAMLAACSDDDSNPATDRDPNASATYSATFTADWNGTDFPTNFPGGAHFSGLIGGTHSVQVKFWEPGQLATNGIEVMAETGNRNGLASEVQFAKSEGTAEFVLSGGGTSSPGSVSLEFDINEANSLVTLVSMLAPSPDWFVGVRDLDLFDGAAGDWKDRASVDLVLYDAGTNDGVQFGSANADTNPAGIISPLTSAPVDTDFINGVNGGSGLHIGAMVFSRIVTP
jgi:hypothetical protein